MQEDIGWSSAFLAIVKKFLKRHPVWVIGCVSFLVVVHFIGGSLPIWLLFLEGVVISLIAQQIDMEIEKERKSRLRKR